MSDIESSLQGLEARIQEIEDDKTIRELIARYGYNADQGRGEAYVNLFTEDGVLNLCMGPGVPAVIQGKEGEPHSHTLAET